ncbi:KUP/HAK/KT family potassium transporter [Williamwhitmania taraxaci]|uniref:Probable potassium transport system protein Kup n=1 Tax=Williamwhitmania taraxaci TaxID=1640674 RepID=A0A1G6R1J4_9BACT|nr:KUP/HAK/KT family potassium transporter [Williamwhitmania taraxaci]SDC98094.1 KUP system potassium uptake protein [Williamwhitmania taraxaci]
MGIARAEGLKKLSFAGVLVTLGIVFGDIGTSPLYVMQAITAGGAHTADFIIGAISCIIWTLTLQTTLKYVIITLRADNKGEGGILALFALLRKRRRSVYLLAMLGASALLADGVITPSITVLSAVEGLGSVYPNISIIPIVLVILAFLFLLQQFGTSFIGKSFGPIMVIWFSMLAIIGLHHISDYPAILHAFNPYYAVRLLIENPSGILILGAVFLCTTGAEALYSDLGHCGVKNIRWSWMFVKIALILNYLGQGAWIIAQPQGALPNPFFATMPVWFIVPGVIIATAAAVIASQALISGSFTIISEAITLNFWPKVQVKYPTSIKGQLYIPSVNWLLFISCSLIVLGFQHSSNMEAAYGLSITLTMIMTTFLMFFYLRVKHVKSWLAWVFLFSYMAIEFTFLVANLHKFPNGGWLTLLLASVIFLVMFIWNKARETKKRFTEFIPICHYAEVITDLRNDKDIPKVASNLVYITRAERKVDVEAKILYSILNKQPKRADRYWLIRINISDEPFTKKYKVTVLIPGVLYRVDFFIGFKVNARINRFFNHVVSELVENKEISLVSNYHSLQKHGISGDFKFIIIDRIPTVDIELTSFERLIMNSYDLLKKFSISSVKGYGLDTSNVTIEQVPLGRIPVGDNDLTRI